MSDNMYKTADLVVTEGQTVELEITDMTDDGKGLGRLSGLAIFVAGAVPVIRLAPASRGSRSAMHLLRQSRFLRLPQPECSRRAHTIRTAVAARCSSLAMTNSSASSAKT